MANYNMIQLPQISEEQLDSRKERRQILNYLALLDEKLRYLFQNLDIEENFSEESKGQFFQYGEDIRNVIKDTDGRFSIFEHDINGIRATVYDPETGLSMTWQTASEIAAMVNDKDSGLAAVKLTADGLFVEVHGKEGYSGLTQRADAIELTVNGADGKSGLKQTAEELSVQVYGVNADGTPAASSLKQRADGLYTEVYGADGKSGLKQTAKELSVQVYGVNADGTPAASSLKQRADAIEAAVFDAKGGSLIEQTADKIALIVEDSSASGIVLTDNMVKAISNQVTIEAPEIDLKGYVTFDDLSGDGEETTKISGDLITTGKVLADYIKLGGWMKVYKYYEESGYSGTGGYIGYSTGDDGANGATEGIAVSSQDCDHYLFASNSGVRMTAGEEMVLVMDDGVTSSDGIHTGSDRRIKNTISYGMERYEDFFSRLQPSFYKMNKGRSDRFHIGFIAQDVEQAILDSGMTTQDFAGLVQHRGEERIGEYADQYYLRYSEFIALNTYMIQKLTARVEELEKRVEELEGSGYGENMEGRSD